MIRASLIVNAMILIAVAVKHPEAPAIGRIITFGVATCLVWLTVWQTDRISKRK